ncbi:L,D-transpeptidase [Abyssogena phaseoliformis symbiont]|uniref:L,D-transpeptidase n=1 Tax=Abyssogena phaseoliformis symbiont TaxID=596095 RepID=UPI001CEC0073|nr:L,D-transpeptidase [Abyssogena phaseoliformis symbiont]
MDYYQDNVLQKSYPISSSINGVGEVKDSFCTPTGRFKISEKIGDNVKLGTVFIARILTGEIYSKQLFDEQADKDWILTRILWLVMGLKSIIKTRMSVIFIFTVHPMNL